MRVRCHERRRAPSHRRHYALASKLHAIPYDLSSRRGPQCLSDHRHGKTAAARVEFPEASLPVQANAGSFDCVGVRCANANFAQDDS